MTMVNHAESMLDVSETWKRQHLQMDGNAMGVERWHKCVLASKCANTSSFAYRPAFKHATCCCRTCNLLLQNYGRHAMNAITVAFCGFAYAVRVERKEPRP